MPISPVHRSLATLIAAMGLISCSSGCQTLSTIGLSGPSPTNHLSHTAEAISQSHTRAAALPRELNETVLSEYVVEPGDVLSLETANFDSPIRLPGDQPVQPDGSIELGKYGRLQVAGMTILEIRDAVQAAVNERETRDRLPSDARPNGFSTEGAERQPTEGVPERRASNEVVVRLVDWKSKVFYVMGEVNSPGAFPFSGNENVLDAILSAGDITQRSNRHRIILSRPTGPCNRRVILPICYDNLVQLGDSSTNYQIMPGDRIFVPSITLWEDIAQTLAPHIHTHCPRCGPAQRGEPLPQVDCESDALCPSVPSAPSAARHVHLSNRHQASLRR